MPDGSCVDAEGFIWNAVWEGYRVERFAPDGRLDRTIEVPVAEADLRRLRRTRSRHALHHHVAARLEHADRSSASRHSGGLFAVRPGVKGLIDAPFAG